MSDREASFEVDGLCRFITEHMNSGIWTRQSQDDWERGRVMLVTRNMAGTWEWCNIEYVMSYIDGYFCIPQWLPVCNSLYHKFCSVHWNNWNCSLWLNIQSFKSIFKGEIYLLKTKVNISHFQQHNVCTYKSSYWAFCHCPANCLTLQHFLALYHAFHLCYKIHNCLKCLLPPGSSHWSLLTLFLGGRIHHMFLHDFCFCFNF